MKVSHEVRKTFSKLRIQTQTTLKRPKSILESNIEVGHSPSKKLCFASMIVLKMMKNTFYLVLKTPFVLNAFKFLSWFSGHIEKIAWLDRLISKFTMSQPDLEIFTIYILPIISRYKGNQTYKFVQLIKYNQRNIFLQKSCKDWRRETSSRPLFVFWKALYMVKPSGLQVNFTLFW